MRLLGAIVGVAAVCGVAHAAPDDYLAQSRAWNGLADLARLAESGGYTVVTPETIDWQELGENDVVFMIYPTERLEAHLGRKNVEALHALTSSKPPASRFA